jgi:prolyl-tRNA editing enzyme YbaK/EbsC (Cys-tRNA(Pro) deacylase)
VRAVLPASKRIDLRKLREVRGGGKKKVHLASEDDWRGTIPSSTWGAVPPIGGGRRDPVVIDSRLAEHFHSTTLILVTQPWRDCQM